MGRPIRTQFLCELESCAHEANLWKLFERVDSNGKIKMWKPIFLNAEVGMGSILLSILKGKLTMKNRESTLIILLWDSLIHTYYFSKDYVKRWGCKEVSNLAERDKDEGKTGRYMHIALIHHYWAIVVHNDETEQLHNIIRQ